MHHAKHQPHHNSKTLDLAYAQRDFREPIPKYSLPPQGMDGDSAYRLIADTLRLDAAPELNLASFVTTWMEPQADRLMRDCLNKNLIDHEEYPQAAAIEERVISIMARLLHAPDDSRATGITTVGSSEAIMLGLLAHKRTWQNRRKSQGKSTERPNMVFGADSHTCIEKFARYFDVEPRIAPLHPTYYTMKPADFLAHIDENTIAVCGILGTTYTGQMDDIVALNDLLARLEQSHGWRIPLHIDAASGGFVVPFANPALQWDFRLSHVRSINVSNHKFGLVYPGMGTLLFRDASDLPEELVFKINYLGGDMPNYSLNFSRPSGQVVAQYYNFLRLGHDGYRRVVQAMLRNATHLGKCLGDMGPFEVIGDGSQFPLVVARVRAGEQVNACALAEQLRQRGWVVPAYTLPKNAEEVAVLRFVVRESLSHDMVESLLTDIKRGVDKLTPAKPPAEQPTPKGGKQRPVC